MTSYYADECRNCGQTIVIGPGNQHHCKPEHREAMRKKREAEKIAADKAADAFAEKARKRV